MKKTFTIITMLVSLLLAGGNLMAEEALEIMGRIDAKQKAETSQIRMMMQIVPAGGSIREYKVESFGRGEKDSFMVFIEPASIRGLRILELDNDTRVFFPSTGRIRRITGDQKSGSAGGIGGDFSYEDMGSGSYSKDYHLSMAGDEGGNWVIKGVPLDPESSYTQLLFFVDKPKEQVFRTEYYTADEGHKKTLVYKGYRRVQGIEMPSRLEMTNHTDSQKTVITIEAARYNIQIDEKYFNPNRFYR